jgi:hypothetical protein
MASGWSGSERKAMTPHEIENMFTYHPPKGDQAQRYEKIRYHGKTFAQVIDEEVPDGPEKDTAVLRLREAVMWSNAAIACGELRR